MQQTHRRVFYQSSRAPVPSSPLSQAVRVNDTLYISGQVEMDDNNYKDGDDDDDNDSNDDNNDN